MKQANTLTPAYAAVQASFWMTWCTSVSFAAVYLQGLGYRNAELGLVTAAGSQTAVGESDNTYTIAWGTAKESNYTVGKEPEGDYTIRDDITVDWSKRSWLTTQQNYSVLSEEVKNCRGFTLEYQIIVENTPNWDSILGDRVIYVRSGDEWMEVGSFEYPDFGAVKIHVYLDQPMDINAVGTIADCAQPNIFRFRQTAYDFLVE